MSMEDILKVLVDSRQPGGASRPAAGSDPMTDLIGSLLGRQQEQAPAAPSGGGSTGLPDFMTLLERLLSSGRAAQSPVPGQSSPFNDIIMRLIQPYVNQLARKVNISPELATLVVAFVIQKLLAHHPTSQRDSTQFNLDDMLQQMAAGQISQQTLQTSGMVDELARTTGLDHDTAARSLDATLGMLGGHVKGSAGGARAKTAGRTSGLKSAGGAKRNKR